MTVIFIRALGSKGPFCRYGNEVCDSACGERDDGSEVDKGELATLFRCTSAFQLHKDEGSLRVGELV